MATAFFWVVLVAWFFYEAPWEPLAAVGAAVTEVCQRLGMQRKASPARRVQRERSSWCSRCLVSSSWQLRTVNVLEDSLGEDTGNLHSESL